MTDKIRAIFDRLPPGSITADMFRTSGYYEVTMPIDDLKTWVNAMTWCMDNMPQRFYSTGTIFWFVNKDDAIEFALVWS